MTAGTSIQGTHLSAMGIALDDDEERKVIFGRAKLPETVQRERLDASYESPTNIRPACFTARSRSGECLCVEAPKANAE
jgi:hypothetical protein